MFKKITVFSLFLFLYTTLFAQNNVALFDKCNYTGKSYYLVPGSYKGYSMQVGNDKLSSMQIPNGMRVTLYEHDDFKGRSETFTKSVACLEGGWNDNASSMVVESIYGNQSGYNNNNQYGNNNDDYVTFYNDCYSKGYSRSLRPGTYSGSKLGILKLNISSFSVYGNLRVRVYTSSDNASGFSTTFDDNQSCLSSSYNDKIRSVVVEHKAGTAPSYNPTGNSSSYATIYTDCHYLGNSLRLSPGYYQGDKLGLLRYEISSIEIPSNLKAKVFINNTYLNGTSYILSENTFCLPAILNDKIGSLVIEERSGYGGPQYPQNPQYPQHQQPTDNKVILYTDANYKGLSASVLPGTYSTMEQAGFINDNLSSLYLPPGYRVVLYEFENFRGKTYTVTETKSGFSFSGWNDKASSIAIYRN